METNQMNLLNKIDTIEGILGNLVRAEGLEKCKCITIIDELLNQAKSDALIMEAKLADFEKNQNGEEKSEPEPKVETVSPE